MNAETLHTYPTASCPVCAHEEFRVLRVDGHITIVCLRCECAGALTNDDSFTYIPIKLRLA